MATKHAMKRLTRLIEEGYATFSPDNPFPACERWIEGWSLLEAAFSNSARSTVELDREFQFESRIRDWCSHFEQALGFAGDRRLEYHEHRIRFCRGFRERFPDEDSTRILWLHAAEADSLMKLGRDDDADIALTSGIERFPDDACGYIGWADRHIYRSRTGRPDFAAADKILKDALTRETLRDAGLILVRLTEVYRLWGDERPVRKPKAGMDAETDRLLEQMGMTPIECDHPDQFIAVSTEAINAPTPFVPQAPPACKTDRKLARWLRNGKGRKKNGRAGRNGKR